MLATCSDNLNWPEAIAICVITIAFATLIGLFFYIATKQ